MKNAYSPADLGPFHPNRDCYGNSKDVFEWRKADVWALGITLYLMLVGEFPPWYDPHAVVVPEPDTRFEQICRKRGLACYLMEKGKNLSNNAMDLLQNMLLEEPTNRITVNQILNHSWLNEEVEC